MLPRSCRQALTRHAGGGVPRRPQYRCQAGDKRMRSIPRPWPKLQPASARLTPDTPVGLPSTGIPISVKDLIDVAGVKTTSGLAWPRPHRTHRPQGRRGHPRWEDQPVTRVRVRHDERGAPRFSLRNPLDPSRSAVERGRRPPRHWHRHGALARSAPIRRLDSGFRRRPAAVGPLRRPSARSPATASFPHCPPRPPRLRSRCRAPLRHTHGTVGA